MPDDHEAPGHTSEAAAAARLVRIADVRSGTAEQEDGATHKSTSSAREKPTKVNVDDEGRSGVRSANGLTPGVEKESRPEEERMCHTFCVMKQTEYGEREDGSACESSLRRVNRQTGRTRRHLSAVAMNALTSGHNSEQVTRYSPQ